MQVTRIGLDIAKSVFHVHGVDAHGTVVIGKQLSRRKVLTYFAQLPACFIGIEACGSAHYWGRELQKLGHDVRQEFGPLTRQRTPPPESVSGRAHR